MLSFESRLLLFVLDEISPNNFCFKQKSMEPHLYKLFNIEPVFFPFKFEDKLVTYFYVDLNLGRLRLNFNSAPSKRLREIFKNAGIDGSITSNQGQDVNLNLEPRFSWFDKVPVEGLEQIDPEVMTYARLRLI